ncbi:NUDIX domain-containing protein [Cumulibacter soli]|uniref:NUDIX domain-containing protein n=1 Tax=Cumulibacter soli TaxID=2546344 RepID=UPI001ABBB05A|nr:NUDIX domain-containing protein [Cumulibacter soli]
MSTIEQLVVAVAIIANGEVLAAQRAYPPDLAGRWELPGGKVSTGEDIADAAVREITEELGCTVRVLDQLGASAQPRPGVRLIAVYAALAAGVPVAREHSALRWVGPDELDDVDWVGADRAFLPELRERLLDGEPLAGGATDGAVRIGSTVRRPTGPWTPAVHELLEHLRPLQFAPTPIGIDDRGREVLTYIPGRTVAPDDELLTDAQVSSCGAALRALHDAMASFRPTGPRQWRYGERTLGSDEVICHNDPGVYNWAFDGDRASGLFDWDMAGPGDAMDDLGFLAWTAIPLYQGLDPALVARRLSLLAASYGGASALSIAHAAQRRMALACERIAAGIARGDAGMANLAVVGEPDRTRARLDVLTEALPDIQKHL